MGIKFKAFARILCGERNRVGRAESSSSMSYPPLDPSLSRESERERERKSILFPDKASGDGIERRIIFEFSKAIKREREGDKAEGRGLSKWLRGWRRAGVME